ncbi:MAG: sulfatase-like hydrolase/transferase [Planctomycetes bacterium]|nr:sulfatase-like hydrolase/transferase [Planctomycetota bacterium]
MQRIAPAAVFLACFHLLFASPLMGQTKQPNLLIIFPDQWRGQALGEVGREPVKTPNLDKLAAQSIVFTEAVSNWPVCSPYRAMLMSGQYPPANGVVSNCNTQTASIHCQLKTETRCWSDVLHDHGYRLGYVGKWHLETPHEPYIDCANNRGSMKWNEWTPPNRRHGFDFWYAYNTYDYHLKPLYWSTDAPRDGFKYVDAWSPTHEADMAIRYIRNEGGSYRQADAPFALVVAMNPPHMPYDQVPDQYKKLYADVPIEDLVKQPDIPPAGTEWGDYYRKNIRNYYAMMSGVDEQIGRILAALDDAGLSENTIVMFSSDHGNCLGIHDEIAKSNRFEEAMRIPLFIRWTGTLSPRHDDLLISVPDFYPTLLSLMGLRDAIPDAVQGVDRSTILKTGRGDRPAAQLYFRMTYQNLARGERGVRTHQYKLVIDHPLKDGEATTCLYDLKADPYELKNLAAENPQIVQQMTDQLLMPELKRIGDPWATDKP